MPVFSIRIGIIRTEASCALPGALGIIRHPMDRSHSTGCKNGGRNLAVPGYGSSSYATGAPDSSASSSTIPHKSLDKLILCAANATARLSSVTRRVGSRLLTPAKQLGGCPSFQPDIFRKNMCLNWSMVPHVVFLDGGRKQSDQSIGPPSAARWRALARGDC
jgi:hypothetical protein